MNDTHNQGTGRSKRAAQRGFSPLHPVIVGYCLANFLRVPDLVNIFFTALILTVGLYLVLRAGDLDRLPLALAQRAEKLLKRFRTFWLEWLLLVGVIYIAFAEELPIPQWLPGESLVEQVNYWQVICCCLLLLASARLNQIETFSFRRKRAEAEGEEELEAPPPMPEDRDVQRLDASRARSSAHHVDQRSQAGSPEGDLWRSQQQQRWQAWIQEEVERLGS
ncbi:MAG TPA: hypothetical protein DCR55_03370 [Lentisphaeria bacterium]|nr:hypothetical protein [Lentisphaeria bacterium]